MTDTYKIYQFDLYGYFTGEMRELPVTEGYSGDRWTSLALPDIPDGQFARYNYQEWTLTSEPPPAVQEMPPPSVSQPPFFVGGIPAHTVVDTPPQVI